MMRRALCYSLVLSSTALGQILNGDVLPKPDNTQDKYYVREVIPMPEDEATQVKDAVKNLTPLSM